MKKWIKLVAAVLTASFAFAGVASAQDMRFFKIGTGGTGGTYYPIGGLIAANATECVVKYLLVSAFSM